MLTLKLPYEFIQNETLNNFQREYNVVVRMAFKLFCNEKAKGYAKNYMSPNSKASMYGKDPVADIYYYIKDHIEFGGKKGLQYLTSYMLTNAIFDAKAKYKACIELNKYYEEENKKIALRNKTSKTKTKLHKITPPNKFIFGGKKNMKSRYLNNITKEKFKENRQLPIKLEGQAGITNRFYKLISDKEILLKYTKEFHLNLKINPGSKKRSEILIELMKSNIPITYSLDKKHVYISFDESKLQCLKKHNTKKNPNIVLGIDMNPGVLGVSIIHNNKILHSEELRTTNCDINQKSFTYHAGKKINELIQQFNVGMVVMEDLKFTKKSKCFNKTLNKKLNQWDRNRVLQAIQKYCNIYNITFKQVKAYYSSLIGNCVYSELSDPCAAATEIARRGIQGDKKQNYPPIGKCCRVNRWKKDLGITISDWTVLGQVLYEQKIGYRNAMPAGKSIKVKRNILCRYILNTTMQVYI